MHDPMQASIPDPTDDLQTRQGTLQETLDCERRRAEVDREGMSSVIKNFAAQCDEAWRIGEALRVDRYEPIRAVVVLGMGGSAIGGDLLKGYTENLRRVPMEVNRDYSLPAHVGPETLVIASSYSGNTEETLHAYEEAVSRGARVVAISTGGQLTDRCRQEGHPVIQIPGGLAPRSAVGYSFVPLLVLFQRLGLIDSQERQFREALRVLEDQDRRLGPDVPTVHNRAKRHALELVNRIPIVYGRNGWPGIVANRWKAQINENAKHPAWSNMFPELNHTEITGWEAPPSSGRHFHVFVLRDRFENPAMRRQIEVSAGIIKPSVAAMTELQAEGESVLAQMFSLIHYGDYVSLYLALAKGVNPTPIRSIERLKKELAKRR